MKENEWTIAEEAMLVTGFHAGIRPEHMAEALRKTPGSVRWKLNQLGLATQPCAPPGSPKPRYEERNTESRRGDLAFKRAMLAAIKAGTENPVIGVVKSTSLRVIPRIPPSPAIQYRSSAALAVEMGDGSGTG